MGVSFVMHSATRMPAKEWHGMQTRSRNHVTPLQCSVSYAATESSLSVLVSHIAMRLGVLVAGSVN